MGSGSVGIAATKLGRRFLGNDLNPEAVQIASRRLSVGQAPSSVGRVPPQSGAVEADPAKTGTTEPMQADLLERA
jgi:ribosomal protein L11 methylase PrmA